MFYNSVRRALVRSRYRFHMFKNQVIDLDTVKSKMSYVSLYETQIKQDYMENSALQQATTIEELKKDNRKLKTKIERHELTIEELKT